MNDEEPLVNIKFIKKRGKGRPCIKKKPMSNAERCRRYREKNQTKYRKICLDFYHANKHRYNQKINCECGGRFTRTHKTQHQKSKMHARFVAYEQMLKQERDKK